MVSNTVALTLPEDLIRRAEALAAQRNISVSELVTEMLQQLTGREPDYATAWAAEERLMNDGARLRIGQFTSSRDETHER